MNPVYDYQHYRYRITLRPLGPADGGGWLAEVPELPGCMSDGETPQEAVENVMDAIACWIEAAEEDGRPVPQPAGADAA
jgi:predicted RNase H-like HicB family nuclease